MITDKIIRICFLFIIDTRFFFSDLRTCQHTVHRWGQVSRGQQISLQLCGFTAGPSTLQQFAFGRQRASYPGQTLLGSAVSWLFLGHQFA